MCILANIKQYLKETKNAVVQDTSSFAQQDAVIMSVIEEMSNQVAKCNEVDKVADFENQIHSLKQQLNATVESHKTLSTTVDVLKMESKAKEDKYLYEITDLEKKNKALDNQHDALSIIDTEEILELAEESRIQMHAKQNDPIMQEKKAFWLPISKPVSETPPVQPEPILKEIPRELPTKVTVRTKVTGQNEGSLGFEHIWKAFDKDVKPFVKTLKEYFHMFDQGLHKEITDMKEAFTQMETEAVKLSVERKTFKIKEKEFMKKSFLDEYSEFVELKVELSKKNEMVEKAIYDELSKRCARMENRCKGVSECDKSMNISKVIALGMYTIDLEPPSPKLLRNKEAHLDYLEYTQENADILCEIVKQVRELRPLDSNLDSACRLNRPLVPGLKFLQAHDGASLLSHQLC
ncbi:hypothetical protein Tco_0581155 [Tanacetum coccineum]